MTRYDYYNVKLPEGEAPFETREQVRAAFMQLAIKLEPLMRRARVDWGKPAEGSPLGEGEARALNNEVRRLNRVVDRLAKDVVEGIAALKPPAEVNYAPEVDRALEDYVGDIYDFVWNKPDHELIPLAIAVLNKAGYEGDTEKEILKSLAEVDSDSYDRDARWARERPEKKPPTDKRKIHECPRCETDGELRVPGSNPHRREVCKRCNGRGYVFQLGRPRDCEYGMTNEGKLALNAGQPWTELDEARVMREVYDYDEAEIERALAEWRAA